MTVTPPAAAAIATAGVALAEALIARDAMTVEDAAVAAWTPTGPPVAELEQRIREDRHRRRQHPVAQPGAA